MPRRPGSPGIAILYSSIANVCASYSASASAVDDGERVPAEAFSEISGEFSRVRMGDEWRRPVGDGAGSRQHANGGDDSGGGAAGGGGGESREGRSVRGERRERDRERTVRGGEPGGGDDRSGSRADVDRCGPGGSARLRGECRIEQRFGDRSGEAAAGCGGRGGRVAGGGEDFSRWKHAGGDEPARGQRDGDRRARSESAGGVQRMSGRVGCGDSAGLVEGVRGVFGGTPGDGGGAGAAGEPGAGGALGSTAGH